MGKGSQNKLVGESEESESSTTTTTATTNTVAGESASGSEIAAQNKYYDWDEIKKHNRPDDTWLVVDNIIYDITKFKRTHPGGFRILELYGGQDGTEPFYAFHKDLKQANVIRKYMKEVGRVDPTSVNNSKEAQIKRDFDELRKLAIEKGLFKPSYTFFFLTGLHIWFLHFLGYYILWHYSSSWTGYLSSLFCLVVSQVQAGWNQHDYGHSSLFGKASWNRVIQGLFIGAIKGASPEWWARTHNMHHAKPNVVNKDPDIIVDPIFVFGEYNIKRRAEKNAKSKRFLYPYDYQHWVFPMIAPTLFTFYFPVKTFHFVIRSRRFSEFYYMFPYYFLNCLVTYVAFQSVQKAILFTLLVRALDSTWFFAVSQCNHITMHVHTDIHNDNWLNLQLTGTCNLASSPFKDWFTGHLNYQIEHHLFPTMPRHNFVKIQPYVQELCKKHNINYHVKPIGQALGEIFFSIKNWGEMWREAYEEMRVEN